MELKDTCAKAYSALNPLLKLATGDRHLFGFVGEENSLKRRIVVITDGQVAGFFSPRREGSHWRIGAIYFLPEFRKNVLGYSIAELAISKFFEGKDVWELVDNDNFASKRLLGNCGLYFKRNHSSEIELWARPPLIGFFRPTVWTD
jgi:ribosomal protein S18 acetylase RimI-like enzyme